MAAEEYKGSNYKPIVFRKEVMYDINSLPMEIANNPVLVFKTVMEYYKDSGILLYDASAGIAPIFTEKELKK